MQTPFLEQSSQKGSFKEPFYNPNISYDENYDKGPFGLFADNTDLRDNLEPEYDFLGFKINTPFGIPSGPLVNAKFCKSAFEKGFDVIHYKTRRTVQFPTNQWPNVLSVEVDGDLTLEKAKKPLVGSTNFNKDPKNFSITNSFGNPSPESSIWQEDLKKAIESQGKGQLLVASVVGTIKEGFSAQDYYNDFALGASLAKDAGAKVIELNLSCPNVQSEGILCYSPDAVLSICQKAREAVGEHTKILIKLGYFSSDQQELLEDIIKKVSSYVDGVSTINTIPAAVVDEKGEQALPGKGRLTSGVCGAAIKWAGLDMVKRLNELRKSKGYNFAIIGVGGVMTAEDYLEYRNAGADVVQSATGAMWNPNLAIEIKKLGKQ